MKYLFDTHALIWYFEEENKISDKIKEIILNPKNTVYVSIASVWEMAIKISIGKMDKCLEELLLGVENAGFSFLQVEIDYVRQLLVLPFIHRDPFDRLIIATAIKENMTIITVDENVQQYNVSWIW